MSLSARRRLENAWRDSLSSLMPTHTIIAAGRTETVDAPYVLVSCPRAEETTPGSLTYLFFLRIAPISNVADSGNADAHDALASELSVAVRQIPQQCIDNINGIALTGWVETEDERADDEDATFADVLAIEGGCIVTPEGFV